MPRNNHTGDTARIRELLRDSPPLGIDEIALALGIPRETVRKSISDMVMRIGGAAPAGQVGRRKLYTSPDQAQSPRSPDALPRAYRPEFTELRRDVFEHRRLCTTGVAASWR